MDKCYQMYYLHASRQIKMENDKNSMDLKSVLFLPGEYVTGSPSILPLLNKK